MNYRMVMRITGRIVGLEALLMLIPAFVASYYDESIKGFMVSILIASIISVTLMLISKKGSKTLYSKEGFVSVGLSWILISLLGAIPFTIEGEIPNYIDALFETISGLTTTGASILTDIESMSKGLLFWRSFTHWIGGMGILVLMMALAPTSEGYSMHLIRAEVPGPTAGKLVPKMQNSSIILYIIYFALTVIEIILLLAGGMSLYDSLVHSFGTAGTGGFSNYSASIGHYDNLYFDIVISVFMVLFGVNFNVYFFLLIRRFKEVLHSEDLWLYLGVISFATLTIAMNISKLYDGFLNALRYSFFQVSSIISTTGFSTADFDKWPEYSRIILVMLMFMGGCAGSTAGGMKMSRIIILMRAVRSEFKHLLRPRSFNNITCNGEIINKSILRSTLVYFFLYLVIILFASIILSFENFDLVTTVTSVITCMTNVGPGLGLVGPTGGFSMYSSLSKIILSACMLFGRLDIFPVLLLFSPYTWRRASKF